MRGQFSAPLPSPAVRADPGDPDLAWFVDADSLAEWFEHYIAGTGWWDDDESGDMAPWTGASSRSGQAASQ